MIKPPVFAGQKAKAKLAAGNESEAESPQTTDLSKWKKIIVVNIEMVQEKVNKPVANYLIN